MEHCKGSGVTAEVHEARLKKRGIMYVYVGGTVFCEECNTYVRLRDPHSVPVDEIPNHKPGEARPR